MDKKSIEYLKLTIHRSASFLEKDKIWQDAFEEYNKEQAIPLKMTCKPCYMKVLFNYILKKK